VLPNTTNFDVFLPNMDTIWSQEMRGYHPANIED